MTEPTDRTPTAMPQDTDTTRQDATVGVIDAAHILGVSTDAVRARLRRGSLQGHKVEGEWRVIMDRLETKRQDATVAQQDAQQSGDSRATVDLTPLTELIERQAHELADARAAAVLWQERARTLEQRLIAIEAGTPNPETTPEPATIAPGSSPANGRGTSGIRAWVKRLWNG